MFSSTENIKVVLRKPPGRIQLKAILHPDLNNQQAIATLKAIQRRWRRTAAGSGLNWAVISGGNPLHSLNLGGWQRTNSTAWFQPSRRVMGYVLLLLDCTISRGNNFSMLPHTAGSIVPGVCVIPPMAAAPVAAALQVTAAAAVRSAEQLPHDAAAVAAAAASTAFATRSAGMMSQQCRGWEETHFRLW
jgi:hypothetical protein